MYKIIRENETVNIELWFTSVTLFQLNDQARKWLMTVANNSSNLLILHSSPQVLSPLCCLCYPFFLLLLPPIFTSPFLPSFSQFLLDCMSCKRIHKWKNLFHIIMNRKEKLFYGERKCNRRDNTHEFTVVFVCISLLVASFWWSYVLSLWKSFQK